MLRPGPPVVRPGTRSLSDETRHLGRGARHRRCGTGDVVQVAKTSSPYLAIESGDRKAQSRDRATKFPQR
jgi:hypothetical protein